MSGYNEFMTFFDDAGERLKREYEIFRFLMDEFRLKHHLKETYPRRHDPDMTVLYQENGGRWCAVGRLISSDELGMDTDELFYAIEIPFDPSLIHTMIMYDYCALSSEMDPKQWLMLVIDEHVRIDVYRKLMNAGYEWLCLTAGREASSLQPETVYRDMSIPARTEIRSENVPEKIVQMKRMYQPRRSIPNDEMFCFYQQAVFMKDYRDHYDFRGTFMNVHPVYRMMTDSQLRGYFSWRTELMENGQLSEKTPVSFLKLYVYELLHLLHSNAQDTFEQLCAMEQMYSGDDRLFRLELRRWINDFVIYYDLGDSYIQKRFETSDMSSWKVLLDVSKDPESHSEEELRKAVSVIASKEIGRSVFLRENSDDCIAVLVKAYRMYAREYVKQGRSFLESVVCMAGSEPYRMFSSAVFYENQKHADCAVMINEQNIYVCEGGRWTRKSYVLRSDWSKLIGETDRLMRLAARYGRPIKPKSGLTFDLEVIKEAIRAYMHEKAEASRPVININMNALSSIRSDAALTRDSLLVEDDSSEEEDLFSVPEEEQCQEENDDTLFTKEERSLLAALLEGRDLSSVEELKNVSASLLCDEINEKLMDEIGDTVIEFDGDVPVLIEDYIEDVKGMMGGMR